MATVYRFGKREKLKSRKGIDALFREGAWLSAPPVRVAYRLLPAGTNTTAPVQAGVTVSKRYFKKAVHRNRIKRLLREAYRLQKAELVQLTAERGASLQLFFVYTDKSLPAFALVTEAINACLKKLVAKVRQLPMVNKANSSENIEAEK